jgi:uncharacterized protein
MRTSAPREVLHRLGLVRPTLRQVLAGLGLAVLLVAGSLLLDAGIGRLWISMGWGRTGFVAAFENVLGSAVSLPGAVVIGITAGVSEELIVRGVLQARLGILLSTLFFTSAFHAYQYGFDALLIVFIGGLLFGIVRARMNTTTSIIMHGTAAFILISLLALKLL